MCSDWWCRVHALGARQRPDQEAGRVGQDLDVAAVVPVFPAPPQVRAVRALHHDAVGVNQGAVEVEVRGASSLAASSA